MATEIADLLRSCQDARDLAVAKSQLAEAEVEAREDPGFSVERVEWAAARCFYAFMRLKDAGVTEQFIARAAWVETKAAREHAWDAREEYARKWGDCNYGEVC